MGSSRASNCRDGFEALTQGVARLQEGSVSVGFLGGEDHLSWLQGQVTQDLRELQVGEVVWSCLCTRSGMLRAVLRVGRTVEGLLVASDADGLDAVEDLVRGSVFLEDVTWSRCHAPAAAFLRGPGSDPLVESLGVPSEVSAWRGTLVGASGAAIRYDFGGLTGWDLFSEGSFESDWGEQFGGLPPVRPETWEAVRIAAGIPTRGVDWDDKTLPPELGPQFESAAISYAKGCYVGQEVLMRIYARGHVNWIRRGLFLSSEVERGARVQDLEGQDIGHVQSVANSLAHGWIASARVRRSAAEPDSRVRVVSGDSQAGGVVTDFPFPLRPAS
ncbi:MAG: hypothetical protein L6Q31_07225 [Fimbriimonadaceae bacterium]|nr:hypothetical protein [Fimbriimonadaceae bacterium]NUM39000.1 hypothetical protein [Armatimonadota bacterium]